MIGIVILNYKNYSVTKRCVFSIIDNPPSEPYHVYIIDNGSNNNSVSELKKSFSKYNNIFIYSLEKNIGFASGNDYGISLCEQNKITECVLTNSDIVFNSESIDKLVYDIRNLKKAVIVGPKVLPGASIESKIHSSMLNKIRVIDAFGLGRFFPTKKIDEDNNIGIYKVYSVSGCCFCINIHKFRNMGGFDKNTFLYNEENILGIQAEKTNYNIFIDLETSVIHEHGSSSGKDNDFVRLECIKSTLYYWYEYRKMNKLFLYIMLIIYCIKLTLLNKKELHVKVIYGKGKKYLKGL